MLKSKEEYLHVKAQVERQTAELAAFQANIDALKSEVEEVAEVFEAEIEAERVEAERKKAEDKAKAKAKDEADLADPILPEAPADPVRKAKEV